MYPTLCLSLNEDVAAECEIVDSGKIWLVKDLENNSFVIYRARINDCTINCYPLGCDYAGAFVTFMSYVQAEINRVCK